LRRFCEEGKVDAIYFSKAEVIEVTRDLRKGKFWLAAMK
jgi:hypothetical protein